MWADFCDVYSPNAEKQNEDRKYLLTYQDSKHGYGTYAWFELEDALFDFVDSKNDINVIEAIRIDSSEEIM